MQAVGILDKGFESAPPTFPPLLPRVASTSKHKSKPDASASKRYRLHEDPTASIGTPPAGRGEDGGARGFNT